MQWFYCFQPVVYLISRYDPQMVALKLLVYRLYCQVNVDLPRGKMLTVERVNVSLVDFNTWHKNEIDWSIYLHLDQGNGCCLNQFKASHPRLLLEELFQLLECALESVSLWKVKKVVENGVIYSDIYITVFDGDSRSTWPKELNGYLPHS